MNNRLFAIGDIHGCFDSLKELVENKVQLQKDDKLILLGDYIDRGSMFVKDKSSIFSNLNCDKKLQNTKNEDL